MLAVDAVYACYHTRTEHCECRKPKPGMLLSASHDLGIDLSRSVMVGDRASDLTAGHEAGCRTIFIERGYHDEDPTGADWVTTSLSEAIDNIRAYWSASHDDEAHTGASRS